MKKNKLAVAVITVVLSSAFVSQTASAAFKKGTTEDFLGREVGVTYHTPAEAVSSKDYLPDYPREGNADFEADKAAYHQGYKFKDTDRWTQATTDADLHTMNMAKIYSVPLGATISPEKTPVLYKMIGDLLVDSADSATKTAKEVYMRERPFVYFKNHTCQPVAEEDHLRKNGSYPSGHTAYGWTLALVLAQIAPTHAEALLKRGYEFGQSRMICGAHWQSDVNAGRVVGAVEYSRLQSIQKFRDDIEKAKLEVQMQYDMKK